MPKARAPGRRGCITVQELQCEQRCAGDTVGRSSCIASTPTRARLKMACNRQLCTQDPSASTCLNLCPSPTPSPSHSKSTKRRQGPEEPHAALSQQCAQNLAGSHSHFLG